MNDENIKEILQNINKVANRETASRNALMKMKDTDYQLLLDYITNLQQENESLRTRIKTIKRLRKKQTAKKNKYKAIIFNEERALHNYKSRCEKASELLNDYDPEPWSTYHITGEILFNLLNILQGECDDK